MNHPALVVSVIIPVHNASASLGKCLEAVHRSIYPAYDVIVVDDCSSDQSVDIAGRFPVQIIKLPYQQGPAAARNRGAAISRGSVLMFLDADVIIQPDTISALMNDIGGEAAAILAQYDEIAGFANFTSQYKNLWLCYMFLAAPDHVSWFWSGCGAILREAFFEVGGFDEQLRECEDYALGYRLISHGKTIRLNHEIKVVHCHRRSLWQLMKSDFKRARDNVKILLSENRISDNSFATQYNAFKVITAYVALVALIAAWVFPPGWIVAVIASILFVLLNAHFLSYCNEKTNLGFCLWAGFLTFVVYLNMGLGGFAGLVSWIYRYKVRYRNSKLIL